MTVHQQLKAWGRRYCEATDQLCGKSPKNLKLTAEGCLKCLRTSYIDILCMQYWDNHTTVEELMDSLHNLVMAGKILYLACQLKHDVLWGNSLIRFTPQGVSDTPAWFVARANEYARNHGKTPFVIYQAAYSVLQRNIEREILPMCRYEGMEIGRAHV